MVRLFLENCSSTSPEKLTWKSFLKISSFSLKFNGNMGDGRPLGEIKRQEIDIQ